MEYLKTVIIQEVTPVADGTYSWDLPVNPVSHLVLTIMCLNKAAEATIYDIADMIPNVHVLHRGTTVLQMRARDLLALNHLLLRKTPVIGPQVATDDYVRWLSLIIPFGRDMYRPDECFPESKAGELTIQLTVDIDRTTCDELMLQLESVELMGASPTKFLKCTTLISTPTALGDWDIDLPINNVYAAIMLRAETKPLELVYTCTIEALKLLADNVEHFYGYTNWESMQGEMINRPGSEPGFIAAHGYQHWSHYAYLDFDPRLNDTFLMPTAGLSSLKLRIDAGAMDEIRVFPIELPVVGR